MKNLLIVFFAYFTILTAQPCVTNPEFPKETDSITITFDISEFSRTDLLAYVGTVYVHTGVNTNLGFWQHVIGNWGDNSVQPALTKVGTNLYSITINNPRDFYNVTDPKEQIVSLNFVLRSADGDLQSEDLFVQIFDKPVSINVLEPSNLPFYPLPGENFNLVVATSPVDSLFLYLNDSLLTKVEGDTIRASITAQGVGKQWLKLKMLKNDTLYSDSTHFIVRNNVTIEELPNGLKPGINYIDPFTVTLALYAPNKEFVYLIGDFNNWEFDPDTSSTWAFDDKYYLKLTPDSTIYWTTLTNLEVIKEYRFQYLVDGNLRIADPYADKILEDEDSYITPSTYPNLISYPSDKTQFSVSIFQTGQSKFQWETQNYSKPQKENLIVYELLLRDFLEEHDYKTLIDTLDYLENLGINAIELMPINEFEGNESWGYNPSFYFAPDKYYGPKNELKAFIDECHKRNIAVIQDIVLNHSFGRSPFVRLYASGDFGPPTVDNPWFNVTSPNPVFSWGYDFNHESEQTKLLVDRVNRYWLDEYKIDGYRFDFTKGFTNKPGDGGSFDQSRIDILKRMADSIWAFDSTAYVILEHFAPDSEEQILTDYGMMVWGNNNYNYNEATMGYNTDGKSNFGRISYKNHGFSKPHLVGYMESHDEERLMYKNLMYGAISGDYKVNELNTALNRMKLASAFFILVPGPKMIWQFGELGYDYSIDYNGRIGNKPIRWDYFEDVNRKNLYKTISALNFLKKKYEVFSTENFSMAVSSSTKRIQLTDSSMNAIIIGNFDVVSKGIIPGFHNTGIWYDYFSGDSINVTNTQAFVQLEPGEFHIYTTVKLPAPEPDILTNITNDEVIPAHFALSQNYPNPFNPSTTINYSIPNVASSFSLSKVTLKIYDILGREITTLVNGQQKPGNYEIEFNGRNLSSGIYFYTLSAGEFFETKKMIMLK